MQSSVALDGEAGNATIDQSHGARLELTAPRRHLLRHNDFRVIEVVDDGGDGPTEAISAVAGDDQHRKRQDRAEVGVGTPHPVQWRHGRHPHPGLTGGGQLAVQFGGVGVVGGGKHRGGERVVVRPTQRNAGVRQVGVDREVAVAGAVVAAAGGRHAGAHQRDHQIAGRFTRGPLRRRHDFGDRHRPSLIADSDPDARRQPEPAVRGVVQRPRVVGGVDGVIVTLLVVVQEAESAADDGVANLADRHRARHRARPAEPNQLVRTGEVVNPGAAIQPVQPLPQRQGLGVAQGVTDRAGDGDPLSQRTPEGPHRCRRTCR